MHLERKLPPPPQLEENGDARRAPFTHAVTKGLGLRVGKQFWGHLLPCPHLCVATLGGGWLGTLSGDRGRPHLSAAGEASLSSYVYGLPPSTLSPNSEWMSS